MFKKDTLKQWLKPQWVVALGFFAIILIGGLLLLLPQAVVKGTPTLSITEAFFSATSATCVTGLSVVDVGTRLSTFGQIVLLSMIQLGGLGITAFSTFFLMLIGRRISMKSESVLMDMFGVEEAHGMHLFIFCTIGTTVVLELLGALVLYHQYRCPMVEGVDPLPPLQAIYYSIFHAISAFCNAGFSLHQENLIRFQEDPIYLSTISTLIIMGGIGFLVLLNIFSIKFWRRDLRTRGRLSLHSHVVLITTLILIFGGGAAFLAMEWGHSLADLSVGDKISCAIFQSVTARTAGFNAVEMGAITEPSRLLTSFLMFVGGSPGSAAGGIKTTTLVVLLATVISMCKNRDETTLRERTIPNSVVRESLVIVVLAFVAIIAGYSLLLFTESLDALTPSQLVFETISALGTVGLSVDCTTQLTIPGRWVIVACMYLGRIGPLVLAVLIGGKEEEQLHIRYPEEQIVVG